MNSAEGNEKVEITLVLVHTDEDGKVLSRHEQTTAYPQMTNAIANRLQFGVIDAVENVPRSYAKMKAEQRGESEQFG